MVECGGLENRCAARHRGFKSYFLRHILFAPFYERGIFILNAIELRRSAETAQTSRSAMTLCVIMAAREALNRSAWPERPMPRSFEPPALAKIPLAVSFNYGSLLTPFRAFLRLFHRPSKAAPHSASPSSTSASNEQPSGFGREALLAKTSA